MPIMKKSLATLTFTALALSAMVMPGLTSRYSVSAQAAQTLTNSTTTVTQDLATGMIMPTVPIYALNTNNVILVLQPGATNFTRLVRVTQANGNLIGIDFRPANKSLY